MVFPCSRENHVILQSLLLPRTDHESPERKQMHSSTLPSISALGGGGWSTPRPGRFTPGKDPVPIVHNLLHLAKYVS